MKVKRTSVDVEVGSSNQRNIFCLFHSKVFLVSIVTIQNLSEK